MTVQTAHKSPTANSLARHFRAAPANETLVGKKILIVDDDRVLCQLVKTTLTQQGAATYAAYGGEQGLRDFFQFRPDLVLLDHMMPGMNGYDMLTRIRELSDVPVIMLSAIDSQEEIVRCLTAGADDYVTKPYQSQVLVARARATLRRLSAPSPVPRNFVYDDGYLTFDLDARMVQADGEDIWLSATEFALFRHFVLNAGQVCTFSQIVEAVWGEAGPGSNENIHTFVYQLRQKLEPTPGKPSYIVSFRSIGYRFKLMPDEKE